MSTLLATPTVTNLPHSSFSSAPRHRAHAPRPSAGLISRAGAPPNPASPDPFTLGPLRAHAPSSPLRLVPPPPRAHEPPREVTAPAPAPREPAPSIALGEPTPAAHTDSAQSPAHTAAGINPNPAASTNPFTDLLDDPVFRTRLILAYLDPRLTLSEFIRSYDLTLERLQALLDDPRTLDAIEHCRRLLNQREEHITLHRQAAAISSLHHLTRHANDPRATARETARRAATTILREPFRPAASPGARADAAAHPQSQARSPAQTHPHAYPDITAQAFAQAQPRAQTQSHAGAPAHTRSHPDTLASAHNVPAPEHAAPTPTTTAASVILHTTPQYAPPSATPQTQPPTIAHFPSWGVAAR